MQSNNGDLYFRAGIDIDGFNVGAEAMEKKMQQTTSTIVHDASQMDDAITKIGSAFTKMVGAASAAAFVKQVAQVRSEIQSLEVSFKTLLGDEAKAMQLMNEIREFAAHTPMQMDDLAKGAQTLLAFNYDAEKVMPTLKALGDISMGDSQKFGSLTLAFSQMSSAGKLMGQDLMQMINAGFNPLSVISEQTGKSISQLKDEMSKGAITSEMVAQAFMDATAEGGKFYGMLDKQSQTIGGALSNVQGALTDMFNEIGEHGEGVILSTVQGAQKLIENYKEVAKILGTLVIAFGAAKAAQVVMNVAQKNGTGIGVIDNTMWAVRSKLLQQQVQTDKSVTKSIREIEAAQKVQIKTLREQITEEEHAEIIRKSRIANLGDVLTETQKARLAQMGLNSTSEEYLPIAVSMLTREQQMQMAKADLTKNNQAYIEALRGVVGVHGDEINSIDDRIEAATRELALAEKAADAAADEKEQLEKKVKIYQDYYEASLNNINATDLQERQEALETAQSELEAAAKNAESAAETRNTAQKKLNELQTKKNAVAEGVDAKATKANAVTKNLLTVAAGKLRIGLKALWAVMKANPVGAVITVVTSLYTIISHFINKSKEAKEAQAEENKEMAEFHKEVNAAKDRLNTLQVALSTATRGSAAYNQALKQVNDMCKEYNVELINTNDNLQTQKQKYDALKEAIEGVTAAKLREQFTTTAMQNQSNRNEETMGTFRENMQNKHIFKEGFRNVWGDEVKFNTMWSLMLNKAQEAASGDSHTYIAAVDDLIKAMQKISGFQIDRQGAAAGYLRNAFKGLVESAKEAQRDVQRADNALKIYEQTMNAHRGTVQEETTSVADLNRQLAEQEAIISRLEKKARTGLTKKEEEELEAARQRKSDIEKRKKNMTGQSANTTKKDADDRKKAIEQMTATELKLENERQAAIISTMREGAEKRQAQLRLEYQQRLQTIKAAEEEYSRQRKAAGESGDIDPNSAAGQSFAAQRLAAEMEYQDKSMTVFDNEIEERKQKYEEYQRWVEAVGKDAANKQFEDLIAEGRTFEEWVNRQIERLNKKGQSEDLTVGEFDFAQDLMREKRAIQNGQAEQSYKAMGEEMQREIAAATTLAEKLEIIDKWLSRIKNNSDNSDARNDFLLNLSQQRTELIDEQNTQFNQTYEKYAKKRLMIERDYNRQISELNRQHRTLEAEEVKRSLENTLQELDTDFLKGLVSTVFKNPTKSNMREAMKTLQAIQKMSLKEFNAQFGTEDFQFTQEQLDDIKNSISDVGTEIKKLGQGYTLADAFRDIKDGRIEGDLEKVAKGVRHIYDAASPFLKTISELGNTLSELGDSTDNKKLKYIGVMLNQFTQSIDAMVSGFEKGGWIGAAISSVQSMLSLVMQSYSQMYQQTYQMQQAQDRYNEAMLELSLTLKDIYDNGFGVRFFDQIKEASANARAALDKYREALNGLNADTEVVVGTETGFFEVIWAGIRSIFVGDEALDDLYIKKTLNELAPGVFDEDGNIDIEALRLAFDNGLFDTDKKFKNVIKEILGLYDKWLENQEKVTEYIKETFSYLGDEALNSLTEAIINGGNAWENFREKGSQAIESLGEQLMYEIFLAKHFDDFSKALDDIFNNPNLSAEEKSRRAVIAMDNFFDEIQDDMNVAQEFGERWKEMARERSFDIWSNLNDEDTMTGSIQNLTEETGGLIAGRLEAMIINQAETTGVLRQSLIVQVEMRNYLALIATDVTAIRNNMVAMPFNTNLNHGYTQRAITM